MPEKTPGVQVSKEVISFQKEQLKKQRERAMTSAFDAASLASLVAGTYYDAISLNIGVGEYVIWDDAHKLFTVGGLCGNVPCGQAGAGDPENWVLEPGYWNNFRAYWIFRTPAKTASISEKVGTCWSAKDGPPQLDFWNQDGQAAWPPQDMELFHFEWVDQTLGTVRIRNYQNYVYYSQNQFFCGCGPDQAQAFYVGFASASSLYHIVHSTRPKRGRSGKEA